ncbi:MAG: hypothetical protein Q8M71_03775 [Thermodesulfovibrionales bacterium]|nr:hypothetical protein [Thermodesulfovibrionales bacterium]
MYGKTKKIILLAIIIAALQLLIFSGTSFSTIVGSGHDLSVAGPHFAFDTDEVCVFCHTPHNAKVVDIDSNRLPLWNRSISGNEVGFTPYSSSTLNAAPGQPRGMTLLCLSCHDGTSALNVVQNYGGGVTTFAPMFGSDTTFANFPSLNIGEGVKDLSNDHPVSFVFDTNLRNADQANGVFGLNLPSTIGPDLRLFNGMLECATCHNPHEQDGSPEGAKGPKYPFLRMSNANSEMCIKCHNK